MVYIQFTVGETGSERPRFPLLESELKLLVLHISTVEQSNSSHGFIYFTQRVS